MKFLNLSLYTGTFVMCIIYLMLAFFLLPTPERARLQSLEFKCTSFHEAERLAVVDFNKGKYHVVLSGEKYFSDKRIRLDSILRANFKIVPLYTGCIGTSDEVYCYMETMAIHLTTLSGDYFFDSAASRAGLETPHHWSKSNAQR
jgi:hypothetical protein